MAELETDVEGLVVALADDKLADYLLDCDAVEQIVDWAHQDLHIPKALLRAFFKLLAPHLLKQAKRLGGTLVGRGLSATARILSRFDRYRELVAWLGQLRQRLDQRVRDARLLDALIAGVRPARSIAEASSLSREFRASWTMMTGIEQAVGQANDLLAKLANPQPALDLPLIGSNKHTRFLYGAQRVPFVGRRAELEAIDRLLADERDFAWWLIAGPAGVGKSRLALEVCLRNGVAWRAGFLPGQHGFAAWRIWQPEQPTLMIADYAAGRVADLREIMLALQARLDLTFPVRLLLLERDMIGGWWDGLARGGQEQALIEAVSAGEPWRLGPMGRDDLWATMRVFFGDRAVDFEAQREQILDGLAEIDPHGRPLFAAMAADALMEGGELRGWDRTVLLRDLLKREDQRWWRPAGIGPDDAHRVWLALASALGGITRDDLGRSEVEALIAPKSDFRRGSYELLSGRPLDSREIDGKRARVLLPLEPDIVGELYVLDLCAQDEDFLERFRDVAWKLDAHRYGVFLRRASRDFFDHPAVVPLMKPKEGSGPARFEWAQAVPKWIEGAIKSGDLEAAASGFKELVAATDKVVVTQDLQGTALALVDAAASCGRHDIAAAVIRELGRKTSMGVPLGDLSRIYLLVILRLVRVVGEAGKPKTAIPFFREALALRGFNRGLDEQLAGIGANLVIYLGMAGDQAEAQAIHADVKRICAPEGDDPALLPVYAMATLNVASHCTDLDANRAWNQGLHRLAARGDAQPAVRTSYAKSSLNLVRGYGKHGALGPALEVCGELAALARQHAEEGEPWSYLAMAYTSLASAARTAGDAERLATAYSALLGDLRSCSVPAPLREAIEETTRALLGGLCDAGQIERAERLHHDFVAFVGAQGVDWRAGPREIGEEFLERLRAKGEWATAERVGEALSTAAKEPDRGTAEGLAAWVESLAKTGDLEPAAEALDELIDLVPDPGSHDAAEHLVRAASALVLAACIRGDDELARLSFGDIERVFEARPDDAEVARSCFFAACNMATLEGNRSHLETAKTYYETARACAPQVTSADPAPSLADLARRLHGLAVQHQDRTWTDAFKADVAALARRHPDTPEIRLNYARVLRAEVLREQWSGEVSIAEGLVEQLALLVEKNPQEASVRDEYAGAVLGMLPFHLLSGDGERAIELYEALASLVRAHPLEGVFRQHQAAASDSLLRFLVQAYRMTEAKQRHDEIVALSDAAPADSELRQLRVSATSLLLGMFFCNGERDSMHEVFNQIVAAIGDGRKPELVPLLAGAAAQILYLYAIEGDETGQRSFEQRLDDLPYADQLRAQLSTLRTGVSEAPFGGGRIAPPWIAAPHGDEPKRARAGRGVEEAPPAGEGSIQAATHSVMSLLASGQLESAAKAYDRLVGPAAREPSAENVQAVGAAISSAAAFSLSLTAGMAGNDAMAERFWGEVEGLSAKMDPETKTPVAAGAGLLSGLLSNLYMSRGNTPAAKQHYGRLKDLAAKAGGPELVAIQAGLAVRLLEHAAASGDQLALRDYLPDIVSLHQGYPAGSPMTGYFAQALRRCAVAACRRQAFPVEQQLLDALVGLAEAHPGDSGLRAGVAMALGSVLVCHGESEHLSKVVELHEAQQRLALAFPDASELRRRLARGAHHVVKFFVQAGRLAEAREKLTLLADLRAACPEDPEIRCDWVWTVASLVEAFAESGARDTALELFDDLAAAVENEASDPRLRELMKGAVARIHLAYSTAGDDAGLQAFSRHLEALAIDDIRIAVVGGPSSKWAFSVARPHCR